MEKMIEKAVSGAAAKLEENQSVYRCENMPVFAGFKECVKETIDFLLPAMFPSQIGKNGKDSEKYRVSYLKAAAEKMKQAIMYVISDEVSATEKTAQLIAKLPEIERVLGTDIQAAYEGDPAAKSFDEVILSYPAFIAISIYRVAHELYMMNIPIVPRMMTEHAHQLTGIDIHPGATIGEYFFIDHGTGVVIGETTTIGRRVKLYQHVTLGAKSFAVGDDGILVKGIKRHPNIGNNVVIYAGATILGGDTSIGDNCVIGGNVWLTRSVEAGRSVIAGVQEHSERKI